jgi:hypothetical protein
MVAPFGQAVKDRPLGQTVDVKARISMCLIALFRFKPHIRTRREKYSGIVRSHFGLCVDRLVGETCLIVSRGLARDCGQGLLHTSETKRDERAGSS